jgi:hypothetical protein
LPPLPSPNNYEIAIEVIKVVVLGAIALLAASTLFSCNPIPWFLR